MNILYPSSRDLRVQFRWKIPIDPKQIMTLCSLCVVHNHISHCKLWLACSEIRDNVIIISNEPDYVWLNVAIGLKIEVACIDTSVVTLADRIHANPSPLVTPPEAECNSQCDQIMKLLFTWVHKWKMYVHKFQMGIIIINGMVIISHVFQFKLWNEHNPRESFLQTLMIVFIVSQLCCTTQTGPHTSVW